MTYLYNEAELRAGNPNTYVTRAIEDTLVCCFGSEVVYVDESSSAADPDGASWETAFKNLDDGLAAANTCDEIWVADGTYQLTTNPANTKTRFYMRKGVGVYGGFVGNEQSRDERDWSVNDSILLGFIDSLDNDPNRVDYIVVADPNNPWSILDGFSVTGAKKAGVHIDDTTAAILHNKISDSGKGVYCSDTEKPIIRNNWLYKNDYGLYFASPIDTAKVHNNTIADNTISGLHLDGGIVPEVTNCIFTGHPQDKDIIGCYSTYSYMEYPPLADPNAPIEIGTGNVEGDPNFPPFVAGTDDYHLASNSVCIDAGDPNRIYTGQRDIDKHFRVLDGDDYGDIVIDMGADEYCDETPSDADLNSDGIVDYLDFAILADAWQTTKYITDLQDLAGDWQWMSCEYMKDVPMQEMSMPMSSDMESMAMPMTISMEETVPEPVERSAAELASIAEGIYDMIEYIGTSIEEDHENAENLYDMKTFLEDVLMEMQADY